MGHIKEPEGVDLIINSRSLTKEEEIAISNYIRAYKARHLQRTLKAKRKERMPARKKVPA